MELEDTPLERRSELQVKIDAITYSSHNLYGENHRVSRLRENLTSGSEGEGLETGQNVPRQSFTRQRTFAWLGNYRRLLVRHEREINMYRAFFHLACLIIVLNRF